LDEIVTIRRSAPYLDTCSWGSRFSRATLIVASVIAFRLLSGDPGRVSIDQFGSELLTSLLTFTVDSVPGALGAGLSVAADMTGDDEGCLPKAGHSPDGAPRSVAAVGVAAEIDPAQWAHAGGPLWEAFRTGQTVMVPDPERPDDGISRLTVPVDRPNAVPTETGSPETDSPETASSETGSPIADSPIVGSPIADSLNADAPNADSSKADALKAGSPKTVTTKQTETPKAVRGAVFLTGEWGGELPVIVSLYLDRVPDAQVLRDVDRYEPLVTQALAVVEYCAGEERMAEQMLQMTQYRRVIEQAKGLVMGTGGTGGTGTDSSAAFATLARASQHFNVRLRNLAVALVEHVGQGSAEHPDDPALVVRPTAREREVAARVWAALTTTSVIAP
jgi:hypothetical protein